MAGRITHRRSLAILFALVLAAGLTTPDQAETQPRGAASQAPPVTSGTYRTGEESVLVHVAVGIPDSRYITGLQQEHFEVREGKVVKPATLLGHDLPASIVFVVDVSASVSGQSPKDRNAFMAELKRAMAAFADLRRSPTEYALVAFAKTPRLVTDFTTDAGQIVDGLDDIENDTGRTALYDGAVLGVEKALEGAHPRKVLVLVTDEMDNESRRGARKRFERLVEESNVVLLTVCCLRERFRDGLYGTCNEVKMLTARTGGGHLIVEAESQLLPGLEWAAQRLANQYTLRFDRTQTKKSTFVKIDIRLSEEASRDPMLKGHRIFGPRGYRSPGTERT